MDFSKEKKLVRKLATNTKDGSVDWKPALKPEVFEVSFRDNTLRISAASSSIPDSDESDILIQLVNGDGETVDSFTDVDLNNSTDTEVSPNEGWYRMMLNLYSFARRRALGADKVMDEIMEALDDIPF
jgi:hypothetical protein